LGTIYQNIEILSKEKGIDPQIVVDAVKDAMLVAAKKHYHTEENLIAEFDKQNRRPACLRGKTGRRDEGRSAQPVDHRGSAPHPADAEVAPKSASPNPPIC